MLSDFAEKKETFLTKGLSYAFGQNMPNSSLFRFGQNKTRNNGQRFAVKKETCFDLKKRKSKKSSFPKGLAHALGQKMPFFPLFRFGQNKTRSIA